MKKSLLVITVLVIASCAGVSDVVSAGKDTYLVANSGTMGWSSGGEQKAKALRKAEDFCNKNGGKLEVIKSYDSGAGGFGKISSAEVEFRCIDDND